MITNSKEVIMRIFVLRWFVCVGMILLLPQLNFSQEQMQDVVYLKNGSIIRGIIIEQVPNKSLKIRTKDGNVFVYSINEVERITKEADPTSGTYLIEDSWSGKSLIGINPVGFALGGLSWIAYEGSLASGVTYQARLHYAGYTYDESETNYSYEEKGSGFGAGFSMRGYLLGTQSFSGLYGGVGLDVLNMEWDWTEFDYGFRYAGSGSTLSFAVSSQFGYAIAVSNVRIDPSIVVGYFVSAEGSKQITGVFFTPALQLSLVF